LATTVFPAASAGAIRQVASMSGAFHGVMTAVTPDGAQETCSRWPDISRSGPVSWPSQSAKNRKLCATRGITLRRCERSSAPLSAVSTAASSGMRAVIRSAIACSSAARSFGEVPAQPGKACFAASTAAFTSVRPPRATLASGVSSMGERSVKVAAELTRRPPIQCLVSASGMVTTGLMSGPAPSRRPR
jgi:hypothetical protein